MKTTIHTILGIHVNTVHIFKTCYHNNCIFKKNCMHSMAGVLLEKVYACLTDWPTHLIKIFNNNNY